MHTLSTPQIQAAAAQRLADARRRAAAHLAQARGRVGDPKNLTLGSMVDTIAAEVTVAARFAADLCSLAGDMIAARCIEADLGGTEHTLQRAGLDCRMASIQAWAPAADAAAPTGRVLQ